LPVKARSEFVAPTKRSGGRDVASTRMLETASAASHVPARRPMRGSRVGAADDAAEGVGAVLVVVAGAHAERAMSPAASDSGRG
jgi:hypothetical protein